jgi:ribosome recycling factor
MIDQIIYKHKEAFEKVMHHLHHELSGVRTGRANPALLSTIQVESYGAKMPIEHMASITASDAKTLTITPWDKSQIPIIEKAIQVANLGFTPGNDGNVIRITLPIMTEDRRREMVKLVGQMAEQARIGVRQAREEVIKEMKRVKEDSQISEDDLAHGQKKLQEMIDEYNKQIKELAEAKEQELMTV